MSIPTNKKTLVASLKSQELHVPDLWPPFASWPVGYNIHYKAVVPYVDAFLESVIQEPKQLQSLKDADFGFFVSCWWPHTELPRLCVMGAMIAWLFVWDDEIDHPVGALGGSLEASEEYINQTLRFAAQCLGLSKEETTITPNNPIISSFRVIGDALRDDYTIEQREFFMQELTIYCNTCAVETKHRLNLDSRIPTMDEFWAYRMGSCASIVTYATADYAYKTNTVHVVKTETGKLLLNKLIIITSVINDIFSLKKEFDHDRVESQIPFLVATHGNPQQAMSEAVSQLFETVKEFEDVAKDLVAETNRTGGDLESVQHVIGAAQRECTGHLAWGYDDTPVKDETGNLG